MLLAGRKASELCKGGTISNYCRAEIGFARAHLRLELEEPLLSSLALGLTSLGLLPHPRQLSAHLVASAIARRALRAHPLLLQFQEPLVVPGVPGTF